MAENKDRGTNPTPTQPSLQEAVLNLALGYLTSRGLHVATELGIADLLKDGPKSIADLVRASEQICHSILRFLMSAVWRGEGALLGWMKPRLGLFFVFV